MPGDAVSEDDEGNANDRAKSNSTLFIFNHDIDLESLIEVNDSTKMKILMQINSFSYKKGYLLTSKIKLNTENEEMKQN